MFLRSLTKVLELTLSMLGLDYIKPAFVRFNLLLQTSTAKVDKNADDDDSPKIVLASIFCMHMLIQVHATKMSINICKNVLDLRYCKEISFACEERKI